MTPQERLERVRAAYARLFCPNGKLSFDAEIVMADLKGAARIMKGELVISPGSREVDDKASFFAMGRRDIYDRIYQMLEIDPVSDLNRLLPGDSHARSTDPGHD